MPADQRVCSAAALERVVPLTAIKKVTAVAAVLLINTAAT
jgi:hypothetical protein